MEEHEEHEDHKDEMKEIEEGRWVDVAVFAYLVCNLPACLFNPFLIYLLR